MEVNNFELSNDVIRKVKLRESNGKNYPVKIYNNGQRSKSSAAHEEGGLNSLNEILTMISIFRFLNTLQKVKHL